MSGIHIFAALFSDIILLCLNIRYPLVKLPLLSPALAQDKPQRLRVLDAVHAQTVLFFRVSAKDSYRFVREHALDPASAGQLELLAVVLAEHNGTMGLHVDQSKQFLTPPQRAEQAPQFKTLLQSHVCHRDAV